MITAAIIGALVAMSAYMLSTYATAKYKNTSFSEEFHWQDLVAAGVGGALAGALIQGFAAGYLGVIAINASISAVQGPTLAYWKGGEDWERYGVIKWIADTMAGAAAGAVGGTSATPVWHGVVRGTLSGPVGAFFSTTIEQGLTSVYELSFKIYRAIVENMMEMTRVPYYYGLY